jgi:hypothetical protein
VGNLAININAIIYIDFNALAYKPPRSQAQDIPGCRIYLAMPPPNSLFFSGEEAEQLKRLFSESTTIKNS